MYSEHAAWERQTWERRRPRLRNAAEDTIFVKATSENPWERGRLARIFLKNAGMMPALPAKKEVFGGCLKEYTAGREICQALRKYETWDEIRCIPQAGTPALPCQAGETPALPGVLQLPF